jgi:membrane protease YdiL (CAAX protease family)
MTEEARKIEERRTSPMTWIGKVFSVIFMVLVYYAIQLFTRIFAVYPHLELPSDWTQPGNWVQRTDHHLWQMLLALGVIFILSKGRWRSWGLNLKNSKESLQLIKKFCYYYGVYFIGIGFFVQFLFFPRPQPEYPLTTENILGMLFFMGFVSGLSEEILFRGMMQTYLQRQFTGVWMWGSIELPAAGLITAVIFSLVHINFRLFPFGITYLYIPQLALAFVLGIYYAIAYHRTGSLLNPILAHNFANGTLYLSSLLLLWLK